MRITFLGTSHGITERDRFTSSTLISIGEKNYLIQMESFKQFEDVHVL